MQRVFIVIGSPRGHTSVVAKGLHEAGVDMSPSNTDGKPYATFEDHEIMSCDVELLKAAGGTVYSPPEEGRLAEVAPCFAGWMQKLVDARSRRSDLWGWKSPLSTLTLPWWLPRLAGRSVTVVPVHRPLSRTAESLYARSGLTRSEAGRVARIYHERMERALECWRDWQAS